MAPNRLPERLPLLGRTVLITSSEERGEELRRAVEALGAEAVLLPVIRHERRELVEGLEQVLAERESFTHIVFTSPAAVRFFLEATTRLGAGAASWRGARVAAVGPATARALTDAGLSPAITSVGGGGGTLARRILALDRPGSSHRVLVPGSAIARKELQSLLTGAGVPVTALAVYDTVPAAPRNLGPILDRLLTSSSPAAVTFSSPSALRAFTGFAGGLARAALAHENLRLVSIGPTTSAAIRAEGFPVAAEASSPTPGALTRAVVEALGAGQ
ncbi:MAG TPA: uroporphyrinogen-III synthase [Planctomycetota bacterium]|nr:uroporphyrinogen-III synthase [Planctomycetota bacterium]